MQCASIASLQSSPVSAVGKPPTQPDGAQTLPALKCTDGKRIMQYPNLSSVAVIITRLYEIIGYYGSGYRIIAGAGVKHNLLLVLAPERVRHSSVQLDLRRRCAWPAWHQPTAMGTSQHMHEGSRGGGHRRTCLRAEGSQTHHAATGGSKARDERERVCLCDANRRAPDRQCQTHGTPCLTTR